MVYFGGAHVIGWSSVSVTSYLTQLGVIMNFDLEKLQRLESP